MSFGPTPWGTEDWVQPHRIQRAPAVAMNIDGAVLTVWHEHPTGTNEPDRIMAKLVAFDGEVIREAFVLSDRVDFYQANQTAPTVAALADGRFVVTWNG